MKKISFILFLLIPYLGYSVPPFFKNEVAIIKESSRFDLGLSLDLFERYLPNFSSYELLSLKIDGTYIPNSSVELGFSIPYIFMFSANDSGILSDIELFSKFMIFKEIFRFFDNFVFQNVAVINISLATGVKKEDGYRSIGLARGLYYPLSSGYSDISLGFASTLLGTYTSLSLYGSFVSVSSKIEPPLAFNTENDHFVLGNTFELIPYYSNFFSIKTFLELTYYIPFSIKSKFINILLLGGGVWFKIKNTFMIKLGYYYNFLDPVDLEKYYKKAILGSIQIRF
ncbi:MAG: hypothetical protein ACP5KI_07150 [Brevinematia bacterium]